MPTEPKHEVWTPAESSKPAIDLSAYLIEAYRGCIAEMLLDITLAAFFRVQVRGIRWKPCNVELGVPSEILLDHGRPMCCEPVPEEDHRTRDVPLKMLQGRHDVLTANRMLKVTLIKLAGQRQADDRGQLPALAHTAQNRRLADGCPRGGRLGTKRKACLIDKYYLRPCALSLFLICGQSWVSQAWTSASLRSRA